VIVFGGTRDVAHSRGIGYPVWSTEITPVTGKWRIETVEINGDIEVAGVRVTPGDIVFADDTGVCFIPRARAAEVLELARKKAAAEQVKCRAIDAGTAVLGPGAAGIDVMTGAELWSADEAPDGAATGYGGAVVFAGQEGPVTVVNISSGQELWTAPGKAPYDDQVAVGDAAVYVVDGTDIVAYELKSGTVRWRQPQDPIQLTQPWHAIEGEVFTMWWNLEARAADTGALRWATGYPSKTEYVDGPRMTSIATNSEIVAVGFVSGSLGGD